MKELFLDWQIPKWHKDWGDPLKEIKLLKDASTFLLIMNPDLSFQLDNYEEGYLRVLILKENIEFGDIHISDIEKRKIAIHTQDNEFNIVLGDFF